MTRAPPAALSRRALLEFAVLGGGTLLLPPAGARAGVPEREPHFFLMIVLNGGADPAYMFDARPLSMTRAGLIQNYLGEEPRPWRGRNGVAALATSLVKPLEPLRDRFSVLNGVYMAQGFDGHLQNMNVLFTGNPFGGDSFVPHLNLAETGRAPASLDAISPASVLQANLDNHSSVVPLYPWSAGALAGKLKQLEPAQSDARLSAFIRGRIAANAGGPGRFGAGAQRMLEGLAGAPDVHSKLARLAVPRPDQSPEAQALALVAECFRRALARSAIYVLPEFFDVHAAELAKTQPQLFASAMRQVATLLRELVATPFDSKRSMLDVTTVMVASEFGRTMRASGAPVDRTGTNHNQLSNSILLGGKGIRGGLVIGASDLAHERAEPSGAHRALDPLLEKPMGCPFDFAALRPIAELPDEFDIEDHLTIGSVVNTVYAAFGVPAARHRALGRNLPTAPVLRGLLT